MLSEQMHAERARRQARESPYYAARIRMADAPGAGAFLHALPSEPGLRMSDKLMKLAIRDMLGLSPICSPMYCCCTGRRHKNKPNPKEGQRTRPPPQRHGLRSARRHLQAPGL